MEYSIQVSDDGHYIVLKVLGAINRQSAMQQNVEAHALGKQLGINRFLVDVTESRNTDSIGDSYEFAYTDMKETEGIDIFARVATLVSPEDHSHDFIETVAQNSGLNVRIFRDRKEALEFLLRE